MVTMLVTVDRVGRVVIPKELRDRLALVADTSLEVTVEDDRLVLSPLRRPARQVVEVDGWPVLASVAGMSISDADVQTWRDDGQR